MEELGECTGDNQPILISLNSTTLLLFMDGQLEESIRVSKLAADTAEELGSPVMGRLNVAGASVKPLLYLGRAEEALASALRPLCLAHLGRHAEAQEVLHKFLHVIENETAEDEISLV